MRCLAVCHTELVVRLLDAVLTPSAELDVLVESPALARRFDEAGFGVRVGDPTRLDTYVKADLTPGTCVIIEDNGRRSLRKVVQAVRAAGGTLVWVLGTTPEDAMRADQLRETFPEITSLTLAELTGPPLQVELGRSVTRQRVQQYQRFLSDADRVLILLHNDPDPDAIASGLALRNILRRTRQTAIIGCMYGVTRPENLRMLKLLDLQIEVMTAEQIKSFDRIALVDVQPHYFPGLLPQVDLVIDHHPEQPGYNAVFKDIRPDYGSTSTILTEHLRAVDIDISERTATAMLYAIKSDTLFFNRQANRADLDAFSYLYPLSDATMIRKMEGSEITAERLDFVIKAWQHGRMVEHVFCAFIGEPSREDFMPYVADFYLQLENVQWSVISGVVNDTFVVSVRNLGYSRNAGDFVRRWFSDIGSAGGHRTMAKAVVPLETFQQKFGTYEGSRINQRMLELVLAFLHEHGGTKDEGWKDAKDTRIPSKPRHRDAITATKRAPVTIRSQGAFFSPRGSPNPRRFWAPTRLHVQDSTACLRSAIEIFGILETDREPHHPACHTGLVQLGVGQTVLRREDRKAAQALDAAQAGGALNELQPVERAIRRRPVRPSGRYTPCRQSQTSAARQSRDQGVTPTPGNTPATRQGALSSARATACALALCRATRKGSVLSPRPSA